MPGRPDLVGQAVDEVSATQEHELGQEMWRKNADGHWGLFRYVEVNQDVDIDGGGDALVYADRSADLVTGDTTGNDNGDNDKPAGAANVAASPSTDGENKFMWMQIYGFRTDLTQSDNFADGVALRPASDTDKEWEAVETGAGAAVAVQFTAAYSHENVSGGNDADGFICSRF